MPRPISDLIKKLRALPDDHAPIHMVVELAHHVEALQGEHAKERAALQGEPAPADSADADMAIAAARSWRSRADRLVDERDALKADRDRLAAEVEKLRAELGAAKADAERWEGEARSDFAELRAHRDRLAAEKVALLTECAGQRAEVKKLTDDLVVARHHLDAARADRDLGQQRIPGERAVPWRFWADATPTRPAGWSPWQGHALSGLDYTATCRLVPLSEADADPNTRGPIGEVRPAAPDLGACCHEPGVGDGEACPWFGRMSELRRDDNGVTRCPECGSTAIEENIDEVRTRAEIAKLTAKPLAIGDRVRATVEGIVKEIDVRGRWVIVDSASLRGGEGAFIAASVTRVGEVRP